MAEVRTTPIGNVVMLGTTEQNDRQQKILYARKAIFEKYCIDKGWPTDPEKLTIDQVLEATSTKEWKNPKISEELK